MSTSSSNVATTIGQELVNACRTGNGSQVYKIINDVVNGKVVHLTNKDNDLLFRASVSEAIMTCIEQREFLPLVAITEHLERYITQETAYRSIMFATRKGDNKLLRTLLKNLNSKISETEAGDCLLNACDCCDEKCVLIILDHLTHLVDPFHAGAALRTACDKGCETIAEYIIRAFRESIEPSSAGWILRLCIDKGLLKTFQLVSEEMGVKITNDHADYALKVACEYGEYEFVRILVGSFLGKLSHKAILWSYKSAFKNGEEDILNLLTIVGDHKMGRTTKINTQRYTNQQASSHELNYNEEEEQDNGYSQDHNSPVAFNRQVMYSSSYPESKYHQEGESSYEFDKRSTSSPRSVLYSGRHQSPSGSSRTPSPQRGNRCSGVMGGMTPRTLLSFQKHIEKQKSRSIKQQEKMQQKFIQ